MLEQFGKQSNCYGKGHILSDVSDVAALVGKMNLATGADALDVAVFKSPENVLCAVAADAEVDGVASAVVLSPDVFAAAFPALSD